MSKRLEIEELREFGRGRAVGHQAVDGLKKGD
jgi:hypothetical protein